MKDYETNDMGASESTYTVILLVETPEGKVLISYTAQLDIRSIVRQREIIRDVLTEDGTVKPVYKEEHDAAMRLYNRMVKKVVTAMKKELGGARHRDEAQSLMGRVFNIEKSQL
jgi:acetyl-CoA carboxylase alpha subunit